MDSTLERAKGQYLQSSLSMLQPRTTTQQLFSHDKIQVDSRTETSNTSRNFRARSLDIPRSDTKTILGKGVRESIQFGFSGLDLTMSNIDL